MTSKRPSHHGLTPIPYDPEYAQRLAMKKVDTEPSPPPEEEPDEPILEHTPLADLSSYVASIQRQIRDGDEALRKALNSAIDTHAEDNKARVHDLMNTVVQSFHKMESRLARDEKAIRALNAEVNESRAREDRRRETELGRELTDAERLGRCASLADIPT